jgi:hypothetical protein
VAKLLIGLVALKLIYSSKKSTQLNGTFLALAVNCFTFWKKVLYFLYGIHHTNHNKWPEYILLYVISNGFWLVIPLYSILAIFSKIKKYILDEKN